MRLGAEPAASVMVTTLAGGFSAGLAGVGEARRGGLGAGVHRKLESWEKAKEGVVLGTEARPRAQARGRPCTLPLWHAIGGACLAANTCPGPVYATCVTPVSPSTSENARSTHPVRASLARALPALSAALRFAQRS